MEQKRVYAYDFVRFVALLMVIGVHALDRADMPLVYALSSNLLIMCNGIFFMLAGMLNMRVRDEEGTRRYYYHKVRNVLLPFLIFVVAMVLWKERHRLGDPAAVGGQIASAILTDTPFGHLWFVRSVFGLLLSAPFFAYIVQDATPADKRRFVGIGLAYLTLRFVPTNLGITPAWGYPWGVFALCFCLAPLCLSGKAAREVPSWKLAVGAFASWGALCLLQLGLGWSKQIHDTNPFYVVESACLYLLLMRLGARVKPSRAISAIARLQFPIYIVHILVLDYVARLTAPLLSPIPAFFVNCVLTLAISLVVALAFETVVVKPVQRLCDRLVLPKE